MEKPKPVIVIADCDQENCLSMKKALEESGEATSIAFAKDGQQLMDHLYGAIDDVLPCLILLDLHLPQKGGLEILKHIKANTVLRNIPVAVMTDSAAPPELDQCHQLGVSRVIVKPASAEELADAVKGCM